MRELVRSEEGEKEVHRRTETSMERVRAAVSGVPYGDDPGLESRRTTRIENYDHHRGSDCALRIGRISG